MMPRCHLLQLIIIEAAVHIVALQAHSHAVGAAGRAVILPLHLDRDLPGPALLGVVLHLGAGHGVAGQGRPVQAPQVRGGEHSAV